MFEEEAEFAPESDARELLWLVGVDSVDNTSPVLVLVLLLVLVLVVTHSFTIRYSAYYAAFLQASSDQQYHHPCRCNIATWIATARSAAQQISAKH